MKNTLLLYIAIALASVILWLFTIALPLERRHQQALAHITEAEGQLADIGRALRELPVSLEKSHSLEDIKLKLNSSLYAKADILRLFRQIGEQAAAKRLTITEIVPPVEELLQLNQRTQDPGQPHFLNVTLHVRGEYASFGEFVRELESAPFFRGFHRCLIDGSRDLSQQVNYTITFKALLAGVGDV